MRLTRLLTHTAALSALLLPSLAQGQGQGPEGLLSIRCTFNGEVYSKGTVYINGKPIGSCPKAEKFLKIGGYPSRVSYEPKDGSDIKAYEWKGNVTISATSPARIMAELQIVYSDAYYAKQRKAEEDKKIQENLEREKRKRAEEEVKKKEIAEEENQKMQNFWKLISTIKIGSFAFGLGGEMAYSLDGKLFVANEGSIIDDSNGELLKELKPFPGGGKAKMSPYTSKYVYTANLGGEYGEKLVIANIETGQTIREVELHSGNTLVGTPRGVWMSPNGEVAVVHGYGDLLFYDINSGKFLFNYKEGNVLGFFPKKPFFISNSNNIITIRNFNNTEIKRFNIPKEIEIATLLISTDEKKAIIDSGKGRVIIWDINSNKIISERNFDNKYLTIVLNPANNGIGISDGTNIYYWPSGDIGSENFNRLGFAMTDFTFTNDGKNITLASRNNSSSNYVKYDLFKFPLNLLGAKDSNDLWQRIRTQPTRKTLDAFIQSFPKSQYKAEAQKLLGTLK